MGVGNIDAVDLDKFILECDQLGGPQHPNAADYLSDFSINLKTHIDESLDPFSDEYFRSQVSLYQEISGRLLNQEDGEQTLLDVNNHALGVNPYNSNDVNFISKHARAVLTAIHMANLPPGGNVLDMGSGWGLSSEMIAFCGANVTCVDINPLFIELNKKRINRLNLPIEPKLSEFDTYEDECKYDMVFFYESLHHSLKPWETLKRVSEFVKPFGKVAFSGEPINSIFWQNWGLRLDALSIYCIRKFGWFESGWSESFILKAFEYAGFELHLYPHVGLDNGLLGLATRISEKLEPHDAFNLSMVSPFLTLHSQRHTLDQEYAVLLEKYSNLSQEHSNLCHQYSAIVNSKAYKLSSFMKKLKDRISR